jgi:hypothetical protein
VVSAIYQYAQEVKKKNSGPSQTGGSNGRPAALHRTSIDIAEHSAWEVGAPMEKLKDIDLPTISGIELFMLIFLDLSDRVLVFHHNT